jgi:CubicO group peptidase (beta-lactamase class C family)
MVNRKINLKLIIPVMLIFAAFLGLLVYRFQPFSRKSSTWLKYESPEEAGFSSEKLDEAKKFFNKSDFAATMIIYNGRVVAAWGDVDRVSSVHSIRKSIISALYGIQVDKGTVDINRTLEDVGIDEKTPLTEDEKQAKIVDLLCARSGIYLPTALEPKQMSDNRPKRGSHAPGTYWFYNNWDFNALGTIYNKLSRSDIFADFQKEIAEPLGMEDFNIEKQKYIWDKRSLHPGYSFQLSTRDMARFGQLFLQNGEWNGKQIVSKEWVAESTSMYTTIVSHYGYGYLWWIGGDQEDEERGVYSATGMYGQNISVCAKDNIVIVNKVDSRLPFWPFLKRSKNYHPDIDNFRKLIFQSKTGEAKANPTLIPL